MNRSRSATPEPRPAARDAPNSGGGPDGRRIRSRLESGWAPEPPAGWQPIGNQAAAIAAIGELQGALVEQLDSHQDVLALAATVGAPLDPTRSPSNGGRARGAVTRVNVQRMFGEEVYAAGGVSRPAGVATSSSSSSSSSSSTSSSSRER